LVLVGECVRKRYGKCISLPNGVRYSVWKRGKKEEGKKITQINE
jgi:hypothetical protein